MKILILRSRRPADAHKPADPYTQQFRSAYAEKVIGNLIGEDGFCAACGPDCTACRRGYDRRFGASIAAVIELPASLPYLLEDPARYVRRDLPPHDILLAVHVH